MAIRRWMMDAGDFPSIADSVIDINTSQVLSIPINIEYFHQTRPDTLSIDLQKPESISIITDY